jgi:hypothetical protein
MLECYNAGLMEIGGDLNQGLNKNNISVFKEIFINQFEFAVKTYFKKKRATNKLEIKAQLSTEIRL